MLQVQKQRINDREIHKTHDHQDDSSQAFSYHFDLAGANLAASAAAFTRRIHKLAHTKAKDKNLYHAAEASRGGAQATGNFREQVKHSFRCSGRSTGYAEVLRRLRLNVVLVCRTWRV